MNTTIYLIKYIELPGESLFEQPKVFIQLKPALQAFFREAKRLRKNEAHWQEVRLVKWEVVGTPRSIAAAMIEIGSSISGGIPACQMNNQGIVKNAQVKSYLLESQQFAGVCIDA
jgi:hypothetical protein